MTDYKPTFASAEFKYMVTLWYRDRTRDTEEEIPARTLEEAETLATDMETHRGKFTVRVYDADGNIAIYHREPYEGITIDIAQDDWLGEIQDDYGLPDDVFRRAIEHWLQERTVNDDTR